MSAEAEAERWREAMDEPTAWAGRLTNDALAGALRLMIHSPRTYDAATRRALTIEAARRLARPA